MDTPFLPLPSDLVAEQAAIAAAFRSREALATLAGLLRPDDFDLEKHGLVWEALLACYQRREPPDPVVLLGELDRRGTLDVVGGRTGVSRIISDGAALSKAMHPESYARAIRAAAIRRRGIEATGRMAAHFYDAAAPLGESIAAAERELHAITRQADTGKGFRTMGQIVEAIYADIERSQDGEAGDAVTTGYPDLDAEITCLFPGQLTVVGARPGVGKTSLLLSLADNLANAGHHVAAFSAEMADKALGLRAIAMHSGVQTRRMMASRLPGGRPLSEHELAAVLRAIGTLQQRPITINDTPGIAFHELASTARRLHAEKPIACLFVDYLQLVKEPTAAKERRYLEVSAVARGLKELARELDTHIIALSQLTREAENRPPGLSDFRESGEIEQAADNAWGLHRTDDEPGVVELHILKHREGALGVVPFRFDAPTTRFLSLARASAYASPEGY
jgi:replicative DNA helicase